jgi:hypothetical protein
MYINFWKKPDEDGINTLDALLEHQKGYMLKGSPDAEIRLLEGVQNQKVGAGVAYPSLQEKDISRSRIYRICRL